MEPAITVGLLSVLFAATHVGLATRSIRGRLVAMLGEVGFFAFYSAIATLTFWAVVSFYADHRLDGVAGLDAGRVSAVRWLLMGVIAFGIALAAGGLAGYGRMPMALFNREVGEPYGVQRITRHPFFAGVALVGVAHALLATHLVGAVLMAGLATLAILGSRHQDAKYLETRGQPYADYLATTSAIPFAAILAGRQRLVASELPLRAIAGGLVAAVGLRLVHDAIFAGHGIWIVVAVAGGGGVASLQSWRRSRRVAARARLRGA